MVQLTCDDPVEDTPDYKVNIGDRIAQALLIPVSKWSFEVVEQLGLSERGTGGFGSSGA
jgi:dUTP pyrophosphatase